MLKIAILTLHRSINYGAVLQAYALQTALNSLKDVDAYLLDYNPYRLYHGRNFIKSFIRTNSRINRCFVSFRKQYLRSLQYNLKKRDLKSISKEYDILIAGSDQVWNMNILRKDSSYLLDFAMQGVKKFSYAASIGPEDLVETEFQNLLSKLEDFSTISLREPHWIPRIQSVLSKKNVRCDIDPVFLLNADQWRAIARKPVRKPYVLFFTLNIKKQDVKTGHFAKRLAESQKIDAVYLSNNNRWYRFLNMKHLGILNPLEFIGTIDNAEYVITNSFHGTAFSIILHKPFFVDIPSGSWYPLGRIRNLLELTGLTDRVIENGKLKREPLPIDWDDVDARLSGVIRSSKDYLKEIVVE